MLPAVLQLTHSSLFVIKQFCSPHFHLHLQESCNQKINYQCVTVFFSLLIADHETGGMTINGGDYKTGMVTAKYTSGGHTGIAVPVYAFGPGAEQFTGFMENTDIAKKMMKLLKLTF